MSLGLIPLATRPLALGPATTSSGNTASIAWTEQSDVFSITALAQGGALAWTEQNDVSSLIGTVTVIGVLGWTEASDVTAITGTVGAGQSGALAWTEADDVVALTVTVTDRATLAWTEDSDVTSITASVLQTASCALAWVEQDDTCSITCVTQANGAGRKKFQVETSRGVIEVESLDEVAQIVRTEKRTPKAQPVSVKLEGVKVSTPSLKPNIDYKAIEERLRAQVQAEMDDEEELLMFLL